MPLPWGGIATGVGSALAGLFGKSGQASANRTNINLAREQMKFQERMSSTAIQRAARDYEAAGLNRILAASQGGASSPAGQTATVENEKSVGLNNALVAAQIYATRQAGRASAKQADVKDKQGDIMGPLSSIAESVEKMINSAKDGAGKKSLYDRVRGGMTDVFEALDIGGLNKTSAMDSMRQDREFQHWKEEPQRVQAKINRLEKNLEWMIDNDIDAKSRAQIKEEIRRLKQQLSYMKGPSK